MVYIKLELMRLRMPNKLILTKLMVVSLHPLLEIGNLVN